jgi:hypothetical protein
MLRLKVKRIRQGLHPSEMVVAVDTADGREELVVDARSLKDDSLSVGYPIGSDDDHLLIELPRETMRGAWRVWVPRTATVQETAQDAA